MDPQRSDIPPPKLISALRGFDLLPAIVFLPTRRKCDEAAFELTQDKSQFIDQEKLARRQEMFEEFAQANPEIRKHKHRKTIVNFGVASHHAGHMPAWKLLIEKMMSASLLSAIFATSTVAAGVDFPARTVVISNADTRGNDGWRPLRPSELQQMTGRAGRRGKDNVGFVVLVPGQFQNPKKIAELLRTSPEPLESQFRATYTSLLNLLDAFGEFSQIREIAEKSFAFRKVRHQIEKLESERATLHGQIAHRIAPSGLSIDDVRGFERLIAAQNALNAKIPASRIELRHKWLEENVRPGRIVTKGRSGKRFYLVLNVHGESVSAIKDDGRGASFALSQVNRVYENNYRLTEAEIENAFLDVLEDRNPPLDEPRAKRKNDTDDVAAVIRKAIDELVPVGTTGDERKQQFDMLWENYLDAAGIERLERDIGAFKNDIWLPFERRARVLHSFGYLDFYSQKVSDRGKWLADLRVDRPLLVGEALRSGVFDGLDPTLAAGLMASLAADADRSYGDLYLSDKLLDAIASLEEIILAVAKVEWENKIDPSEEINLSAAAAAERWAGGMRWDELVARTKAEEGDLVRLMSRTGEALLQIAHLKSVHAAPAELARDAAEMLLREPVRS